jgi:hypothetical protein
LVLNNVTLSQSGNRYSVIVANTGGSVTSTPALLTVADISSPTVGYWRLENSADLGLDSGGNGLKLTHVGAPTAVTLCSGPGAFFPSTLPSTGLPNTGAVEFDGASYMSHGDWPSFSLTNLTIEAYVHRTSLPNASSYIASQYATAGNRRSWGFGVAGASPPTGLSVGELFVILSGDGVVATPVGSGLILELDTDYYVAASVNITNSGSGVTFYLKDFSANGPLTIVTKPNPVDTLHDSTADFSIGAWNSIAYWFGVIDEVRLSRVVLSPGQLLVSQPGSSLATVTVQADGVQLTGSGVEGLAYSVLRSTNLGLPNSWEAIATNVIAGAGGSILFTDTNAPSAKGFYRLRQP